MDKTVCILVVEDSEEERVMYAHHLYMQGYRVAMARDGKEGLERAFEYHPDLILMDLWLPTIAGSEAIRHLKADARTKNCPIVVITGDAMAQPSTLICDGWLTKPCALDRLDAEISRLLPSHP